MYEPHQILPYQTTVPLNESKRSTFVYLQFGRIIFMIAVNKMWNPIRFGYDDVQL